MSRKRKTITAVLVIAVIAIVFVYAQIDIAAKSIQFDLRKIGESVYEARSKSGKWPVQIADLEGTEYLEMPHRRTILEKGLFVIVWQRGLDRNPEANRNRILAYDNGSLLARLGWLWVCRGDLRIQRMSAREVREMCVERR